MADKKPQEGDKVIGIMDKIVYQIKKITHSMVVLVELDGNRELIIGASALMFFKLID
jgi:hypothetical protein